MAIRDYRNWEDLMSDVYDDWARFFPVRTYSYTGQWYDPQKFTLTPKKEYKEELIKNQEQEIADIKTKLAEAEDKLKALKSG